MPERGEYMPDKFFVWWSLIAVALTYGGIIAGAYSDKKTWITLSRVGQIVGAVGLFAILFYLAVK